LILIFPPALDLVFGTNGREGRKRRIRIKNTLCSSGGAVLDLDLSSFS